MLSTLWLPFNMTYMRSAGLTFPAGFLQHLLASTSTSTITRPCTSGTSPSACASTTALTSTASTNSNDSNLNNH